MGNFYQVLATRKRKLAQFDQSMWPIKERFGWVGSSGYQIEQNWFGMGWTGRFMMVYLSPTKSKPDWPSKMSSIIMLDDLVIFVWAHSWPGWLGAYTWPKTKKYYP